IPPFDEEKQQKPQRGGHKLLLIKESQEHEGGAQQKGPAIPKAVGDQETAKQQSQRHQVTAGRTTVEGNDSIGEEQEGGQRRGRTAPTDPEGQQGALDR